MTGARLWRSAAVILLAVGWASGTEAHVRSESFSRWHHREGLVTARFTVNAREVTRIPAAAIVTEPSAELARYLDSRIQVHDLAGACRRSQDFRPVDARPGYVQAIAHWRCDGAPDRIVIDAFFDLAAEHSHFATVETAATSSQRLLTSEQRSWKLAAKATPESSRRATFASFVGQGFRHIISGLDHIVFLVVLLVACRRAREVFWAVTGFTLGHSLTLGLAAAGVIQPKLSAVEATIGLTIALVAVERSARGNGQGRSFALGSAAGLLLLALASRWLGGLEAGFLAALALFAFCYLLLAREARNSAWFKLLVTTLFGLVHGLGFAAAFQASHLSPGQLLWPLAGFNIGVELGQLALVGLMGIAVAALTTRPRIAAWSADLAAAAGCAIGVYWFVLRGFS